MVAAVPPDPLRGLRDDLLVMSQGRSRARSLLPSWYEALQTGSSVRCVSTVSGDRADRAGWTAGPAREPERLAALLPELPDMPLLKYRVGICDATSRRSSLAAQSDVPDFVDADYELGRYALRIRKPQIPDEAMRRFRSAAAAFPSSTSIPTAIGNLYQSWEDWANALAAYDAALALLPSHPDAQIGRVISLPLWPRDKLMARPRRASGCDGSRAGTWSKAVSADTVPPSSDTRFPIAIGIAVDVGNDAAAERNLSSASSGFGDVGMAKHSSGRAQSQRPRTPAPGVAAESKL